MAEKPAAEYPPNPLRTPITYTTTHSSADKSSIIASSRPATFYTPLPGSSLATVHTTALPPNFTDERDLSAHATVLAQQEKLGLVKSNGCVIRYVDFAPGVVCGMHRTQSLDFGILVEGSLMIVLDGGEEKKMDRGDVCVQRGTMHGWRNDGDTWARVAFVLLASEPVVVGGEKLETGFRDDKAGEISGGLKAETE